MASQNIPTPINTQLPPGWQKMFTPEGRPYYIDHNTQKTSWIPPAPPPPYSSSPAYSQHSRQHNLPIATAIPVSNTTPCVMAQPVRENNVSNSQNILEDKKIAAKHAFSMYDTDKSGTIDVNEFYKALSYLGISISYENTKAIFEIIDTDKNGTLNIPEFIDYYCANY